jgi:hypothetical protein
MKRPLYFQIAFLLLIPSSLVAQGVFDSGGRVRVFVVKDPYTDSRSGPERLKGPDLLASGGLKDVLVQAGCVAGDMATVKMPAALERQYGEWNRAAHTNRVLGKAVSENGSDHFVIGLLAGSKSLVGMLAGLQHLGPERQPLKDSRGRDILGLPRLGKNRPLKVGLVWIDSKGSFNTPDITLQGNMGGMNVAVAAGKCNSNLRLQAGLDPPLSTKYIVMAGVRNTNPYEEVHIDDTFIERISVDDLRGCTESIDTQMNRLSRLTDILYVHVDLSVLDPAELPGHPEAVPDGPTSTQLAECLKTMFKHKMAAALGIASLQEGAQEITMKAAYKLIEGAIEGVKARGR